VPFLVLVYQKDVTTETQSHRENEIIENSESQWTIVSMWLCGLFVRRAGRNFPGYQVIQLENLLGEFHV
jgi:hypothetical protein